jgi:hypothetical protein
MENNIEFLSESVEVSMGDTWFEVVSIEHFWIIRRFQVLNKLVNNIFFKSHNVGEIDCGNGLVQRQFEIAFDKSVDGYDLNVSALKSNISKFSRKFCYDVLSKKSELNNKYDILLMMDVLEHIDNEIDFLSASKLMIADDGVLIINVPAFQNLYSKYDLAVGHIRRYNAKQLIKVVEKCGFECVSYSYWGLPLTPLLWLRKIIIRNKTPEEIIQTGMEPGSKLMNWLLLKSSNLEIIPNHFYGSSLMAVFKKK